MWTYIDVLLIKKETDNAFLCECEDLDEAVWIPKSQIADVEDYEEGDESITLAITEFIAREKGLLE